MFETKLSEQEILERLNKRNSEIKKLDKLPALDKFYLTFLSQYNGAEITPDIELYKYETALSENKGFESDFPEIGKALWLIGSTGQGDEWFLDKTTGKVLFYDHNEGDYESLDQFVNLNISFLEFLQMAFLFQELEDQLDMNDDELEEGDKRDFEKAIKGIQGELYEVYPFKYF